MSVLAVIPARYASTRFPGKPLADRTGKPLIQHVVERVQLSKSVGRAVVATDDQRIFDAVTAFGGDVIMTGDHPNGTSRIAEVIEQLGDQVKTDDIIVNVQGDEPEIEPDLIDALVAGLAADLGAQMATLASPFAEDEDPADPNIVKLVLTETAGTDSKPGLCRALYFSRSLIPYDRDNQQRIKPWKHPGMYAYRRDFLMKYVTLAPTPLEETECLEQLRALEHGHPIAVAKVNTQHHGIDTPEQYEAFVQRMLRK